MQLRDLQRQYQYLKPEIDQAIAGVVESSAFIMGQPVKELEQQLAQYVGVKHCVACGNGTDALRLALMAWGIGPGDAVFVPDFTFFASAEVVAMQGATPIFVDVNPDTYNIDIVDLEQKIQQAILSRELTPKVILAVDLFGQPADYAEIRELADIYELRILEDGAQGFGGSIWNDKACSFGDISTTSFFPAKPLGCYGDGGAVFTNDDEWAQLLRSYIQHGKGTEKYDNVRIGCNSRLDTLQAAVLLTKLKYFPQEVEQVNEVAYRYSSLLEGYVKCPVVMENFRSSWAQYTIQLNSEQQRNSIQQSLKAAGIPTAIYYPKPLHLQSAFAGQALEQCPQATRIAQVVLSLPMHPYLTPEEQQEVAETLIKNL